jgi:hypothetical protein
MPVIGGRVIAIPSPHPELPQRQLQPWEFCASFQHCGLLDLVGFAAGAADINGSLLRQQQPTQPSSIGLVAIHLATQGGNAPRNFVAGARPLEFVPLAFVPLAFAPLALASSTTR